MSDLKLVVDGQDFSLRIAAGVCETDGRHVTTDIARIGDGEYSVIVDGQQHFVSVSPATDGSLEACADGLTFRVKVVDPRQLPDAAGNAVSGGAGQVRASMPGKVVAILVKEGQSVTSGQGLMVVEAMKMQNEMRAPSGGIVRSVSVRPGDSVASGDILATIE